MDFREYSAGLDRVVAEIEQLKVPPSVAAAGDPLATHLWMASAIAHRLADYAMKNETDYTVLGAIAARLGHRLTARLELSRLFRNVRSRAT